MPSPMVIPRVRVLDTQTTLTTTTTTKFTLGLSESYRFILEVSGTISGTTEVLDAYIETSVDGGTTYYPVGKFTQATTAAINQAMTLRPGLGVTAGAVTTITRTAAATAFAVDGALDPTNMRVNYVVGGTSPSYGTVKLSVIEGSASGPSNLI